MYESQERTAEEARLVCRPPQQFVEEPRPLTRNTNTRRFGSVNREKFIIPPLLLY